MTGRLIGGNYVTASDPMILDLVEGNHRFLMQVEDSSDIKIGYRVRLNASVSEIYSEIKGGLNHFEATTISRCLVDMEGEVVAIMPIQYGTREELCYTVEFDFDGMTQIYGFRRRFLEEVF